MFLAWPLCTPSAVGHTIASVVPLGEINVTINGIPPAAGGFRPAAVCRRGHVVTTTLDGGERAAHFCVTCGAAVLLHCPICNYRIKGATVGPRTAREAEVYVRPGFCDGCGNPFPWASRQARIYELMNLLDAEQLDSAVELKVREQLQALADEENEEEEEARWERVKRLAPTLWEKSGVQKIITTLVLAEARVRLGLPPA